MTLLGLRPSSLAESIEGTRSMVAKSFGAAPRAEVIAMKGKCKHNRAGHLRFQWKLLRTLNVRGHHRKGERSNKDCHDDFDNLARISITLVDERSTKAECWV